LDYEYGSHEMQHLFCAGRVLILAKNSEKE